MLLLMRKWKMQGVLIGILLAGCQPDLTDDPIPPALFQDIVLNLSLPANTALLVDGGYILRGEGVRGIIVYRKNATTYLALERNCSYQPNTACATVDVHASTLFLLDACCGSTFSWEGIPTGGPAWRPLRQYVTILNGNQLTITDDIAN